MPLTITATDRRDLNAIFAKLFQMAGFTYGITQAGANLGEIIAAGLSDLSSLASNENGYGASLVGIRDAGNLITATTVEGALAELAGGVGGGISANNLASTANGKGASLVGIEDSGALITATTVEGALAELATAIAARATSANLAATTANKGASLVGIQDAGNLITATTVEGALAELATAVASAGGGVYLSPVQLYGTLASSYGLSPGDFLGDYTTGAKFVGLKALSVTGVRVLRYANDCTYTVKLWINGSAVATKSQAVTAGSPVTILFNTPVSVPVGTGFILSVYDGGTRYSYTTTAPTWEPADYGFYPVVAAGVYLIACGYASGDTVPTVAGSAHRVPIEPVVA